LVVAGLLTFNSILKLFFLPLLLISLHSPSCGWGWENGGEKTFKCSKYLLEVLEENGSSLFIIVGIILKANLII